MQIQFWTETRVDQLKELWAAKVYSASEIGAAMSITRNAVLGKAHRLGLESHAVCYPPRVDKIRRPKTVFSTPEKKPRLKVISPMARPSFLMNVVSPITGQFISARRRSPLKQEFSKPELRAMFALAAANTAKLDIA